MTHEISSKSYTIDTNHSLVSEPPETLEANLSNAMSSDNDLVERGLGKLEARELKNRKVAAYVMSNLPEVAALAKSEAEADGKTIDMELPSEPLPPPTEEDMQTLRELIRRGESLRGVPGWRKQEADWQHRVNENSAALNELSNKIREYSGVDVQGIAGLKAGSVSETTPKVEAYPEMGATGVYKTQDGYVEGKVVAATYGGPYVFQTPQGKIQVSKVYR